MVFSPETEKALTVGKPDSSYFCFISIFYMKNYVFASLLVTLAACNSNSTNNGQQNEKPVNAPRNLNYSIVASYPHDTSSYTQGLLLYNGNLYEGTGNYGKSKFKQVDLKTGRTLKEIALDEKYFGEGLTILRDTAYQLTWREKKVFVYTLKDFKKIKEYDVDFQGWGLTNNGKQLIISNGTGDLFFYNPNGFTLERSQTVTEGGTPTFNLNELEYIDGYVYANQYEYPYIFKIDPATGEIVAKADVTSIWDKIKKAMPDKYPTDIVPNGIAYDPATKKIYITGKWWPELYEISLAE